MYACELGHTNIVSQLVDHVYIDVNIKDANSRTALEYACINNQEKIVSILLKHEDIKIHMNKNAAFKIARRNGFIKVLKLLIPHVQEINVISSKPETKLLGKFLKHLFSLRFKIVNQS